VYNMLSIQTNKRTYYYYDIYTVYRDACACIVTYIISMLVSKRISVTLSVTLYCSVLQ